MALIGSSQFKRLPDITGQKTKIAIQGFTLAAALEPQMMDAIRRKLQLQRVNAVVIHLGDNDIHQLLANVRKVNHHNMREMGPKIAAKLLISQMNELVRQVKKVAGADVKVYVLDLFRRDHASETFNKTRLVYNQSMNQLMGATIVRFSRRLKKEHFHEDGVHLTGRGSRFLASVIKGLIYPPPGI